jgi:type IV pilus assembly protein PilE
MNVLTSAHRGVRALRRGMRGVTLLELMVVVAILAILATIAVPTYRRYLLRSQRSEAKIALLQLQTAQEKFYLQNNQYTTNITAASPAGLGLSALTETGKYDLTVAVAADADGNANQTFTATATPAAGGGQADDTQCANFTIDERGTRGVSGSETAQYCWK